MKHQHVSGDALAVPTEQKWESALLRTALWAGMALLAAQAWARVFLHGYLRQCVEERLWPFALIAGPGLLCCSVAAAAFLRPPSPRSLRSRALCLGLALVAVLSALLALLPEILGEAIIN